MDADVGRDQDQPEVAQVSRQQWQRRRAERTPDARRGATKALVHYESPPRKAGEHREQPRGGGLYTAALYCGSGAASTLDPEAFDVYVASTAYEEGELGQRPRRQFRGGGRRR